ncbi:hypothetical protein UFOVP1356_40 [uncultured Caudovirales phage]|uniref:Uncharacterized protein n=1 Tax=uncultured Caudovirales phage TaxID=2100421 RepID=A0A6J5S472_9CAUD|nr:hypothetical protein UFOVP1356_40 [uncultured Caudovirales phage]
MARRIRLDLMTSGIAQTGNGASFDWPGGRGVLICESLSGGTIGLQTQAVGGTWIPVIHFATTTDIALAAGKMANFEIAAGPVRAVAGANTGCVCSITGVPLTAAG